MPQPPKKMSEFQGLMELVAILRGPEGCPWDKEQTAQSLAPFAIEETYELVDAIECGTDRELKEELGDVLFQVALQAQVAAERKAFHIEDVLQTLNEKMVRRHPHVFAQTQVTGVEQVWQNWEKIKAEEKKGRPESQGYFSSVPRHLPALQRAYKIGVKTEKLKFDWPDLNGVLEKLNEELSELEDEIPFESRSARTELTEDQRERLEHEMGDVLFSLAQMARHLDLEPEQCLRKACLRFETRFEKMMSLVSAKELTWDKLTDPEKEKLWQEAKSQTQKSSPK